MLDKSNAEEELLVPELNSDNNHNSMNNRSLNNNGPPTVHRSELEKLPGIPITSPKMYLDPEETKKDP